MKKLTIVFIALALTVGGFSAASAFADRHGCQGGPDLMGKFGFPVMLQKLHLTQDQKGQVASILSNHRTEIGDAAAHMSDAIRNLMDATSIDPYSQDAVNQAAQAVANQQEQNIVLRARIMNEIKQILTPDQLTAMNKIKDNLQEWLNNRVTRRLDLLDNWIAKHSG
jgi:Spy/CpxP family protein refolding chaperone